MFAHIIIQGQISTPVTPIKDQNSRYSHSFSLLHVRPSNFSYTIEVRLSAAQASRWNNLKVGQQVIVVGLPIYLKNSAVILADNILELTAEVAENKSSAAKASAPAAKSSQASKQASKQVVQQPKVKEPVPDVEPAQDLGISLNNNIEQTNIMDLGF